MTPHIFVFAVGIQQNSTKRRTMSETDGFKLLPFAQDVRTVTAVIRSKTIIAIF